YNTGFEKFPETDWQVFRTGPVKDFFYEWKGDNTIRFEGTLSLYHGYPIASTDATDEWYVSPAFSLTSGGKIDSIRHHFMGSGTPGAGDTVGLYLLRDSPDPALASSKTLLYDFRGTKYKADFNWNKTTGIAIPATTGKAYIAIRYRTTTSWMDVRFDNLGISANKPSSIGNVYKKGADFTASPVPVINILNITTTAPFQWIEIYDVTGRMLDRQVFQASIDLVRYPAGTYILMLKDAQQQNGTLTIIKQ
ncbi:MAG: hypothetical protein DI538_29740, partial [Azospira oryzae]